MHIFRLGSNGLVNGVSRAGNRYTRCSHAGDLSGAVRRGPARRFQVADVDQDADQSVNGEGCEEGIGMDRATRLSPCANVEGLPLYCVAGAYIPLAGVSCLLA